jgi:protein-tyrosine phosphatase
MTQEQSKPLKQALRRVVPDSLIREGQIVLRLGPGAGQIYARLRLLDSLGIRSQNSNDIPPGAQSFLFVCFGNIMRSPMAELMFRKATEKAGLARIRATSAGLHAIPGSQAHPWALEASTEIGLSLESHQSQQLTEELVSQSDVIFAMDFQNKAELLALYPQARDKILMLSAYANGAARSREISDPYSGDVEATRRCYALIQACIQNLTARLVAVSSKSTSAAQTT